MFIHVHMYSQYIRTCLHFGQIVIFVVGVFILCIIFQIYIGVMANIIIFPINFLLITLFRKSRPRKLRPSRVEEALRSVPERTTSMADVNPRVKSSLDYDRPGSSFLMDGKRTGSSMSRPGSAIAEANLNDAAPVPKKKKKCQLPWWFTIVAWILLWMAILVSAAFVTFYGIMFQDIKCKKWITSMLISFFMSVFFTQPIKVIAILHNWMYSWSVIYRCIGSTMLWTYLDVITLLVSYQPRYRTEVISVKSARNRSYRGLIPRLIWN